MPTTTSQPSPVTVCTLWEGDYHKGLGALSNSLIEAGYRGTIWAGYRGAIPQWATPGEPSNTLHLYRATDTVSIAFVRLPAGRHLALCKPDFMAAVLNDHAPGAEGIFYFDPDIVLLAEWPFFVSWLASGIAVCEDYAHPINPSHPRATAWTHFARSCGLSLHHPAEAYLNSGLLGLTRQDAALFLDQWALLIDRAETQYSFSGVLQFATRSHPFHSTDQDALNIAAMTFPGAISRIGPDGMGFSHGEWLTIHAIQTKKPWRRRLIYDYLTRGAEVERGTRFYWTRFAAGPVRFEPGYRIQLHRFLVPFIAFLSRFYRRR